MINREVHLTENLMFESLTRLSFNGVKLFTKFYSLDNYFLQICSSLSSTIAAWKVLNLIKFQLKHRHRRYYCEWVVHLCGNYGIEFADCQYADPDPVEFIYLKQHWSEQATTPCPSSHDTPSPAPTTTDAHTQNQFPQFLQSCKNIVFPYFI